MTTTGEMLLNRTKAKDIVHISESDLDRKLKHIFKFCDIDTKIYAGFNFWYYLSRNKKYINSFEPVIPADKDYVGSITDTNVYRLRNHPNTLLVVQGLKVSIFEHNFDFSKQPLDGTEENGVTVYPYEGTTLLNTDINVHNFIRWAMDNKRRMIVEILRITSESLCALLRKTYADWETLYVIMNHNTWGELINDKRFVSHYVSCNHYDSIHEGIFGDFVFEAEHQPAILIVDSNRVFPELKDDHFIIVSNSIRGSSTYDIKINGEFDD